MQKRFFPGKTISPYLAKMPILAFWLNRDFPKDFPFYFNTIDIETIDPSPIEIIDVGMNRLHRALIKKS
jgi:hypothetical protein